MTPIGKPYSVEELTFLHKILWSGSFESAEHHVEACALKIVLYYRLKNYLKRWEKEEYTGDKLEKLRLASPIAGNFVQNTLRVMMVV